MPIRSRLAAASCAVLVLVTPADAQTVEVCQVVRVTDAVVLERGGRSVAAVPGHVLARADRIGTGPSGRATLRCNTGLEMTIGPGTLIALERIMAPGRERPGVDLFRGIAGFFLDRGRPGGFEVRTPSAVAAVRSTTWAVAVEDRATAAFVSKGRVLVAGRGGAVALDAGEGVDVTADGVIGPPKSWGAERIEGFARRLGGDWTAR
ncbi:FecR family protein [Jannaschia sp. LMIT008]|uniref:FecR family protein n=1 Tax=Jannaschia maritima TaxID=3032585 RepID=UPI0028119517|nr:FecR family protein [Jannaschia sp. LMIT008]